MIPIASLAGIAGGLGGGVGGGGPQTAATGPQTQGDTSSGTGGIGAFKWINTLARKSPIVLAVLASLVILAAVFVVRSSRPRFGRRKR